MPTRHTKRILGIILIILGVTFLATSFYINSRVSSGREQIADAKDTVNKGKQLFALNPVTEEVGKGITASADRKIQEGSALADRYEMYAMWLQISGGLSIAFGLGLLFISRKKK